MLFWISVKKNKYITLGGYAGTGKTTLIAVLRKKLNKIDKKIRVAFVSYTGKAARVLQKKLQEQNNIFPRDSVGTIHSLIYSPIINEKKEIVGWKQKEKVDKDLIIIDEASMVDEFIWQHLLSYEIPIIAVGDHGQLSPIRGSFNLMEKPMLLLTEIHRQAKKNPIINLSIQAREKGKIPVGRYSDKVIKFSRDDFDARYRLESLLSDYNPDTLVVCAYNHTRKKINTFIREKLGFEILPAANDRVICLRNNYEKGIFNGMLGTIAEISPEDKNWYKVEIKMDGEIISYEGLISAEQFNSPTALNFTPKRRFIMKGDLFDFGYALTVHKAQGSEARRVVLLEERFPRMNEEEWRRWLYTAVTRAKEELYIFS